MNFKLYQEKVEKAFDEVKIAKQESLSLKKPFRIFLKQLKSFLDRLDSIRDEEIRCATSILYYAVHSYDVEKITEEHLSLLEKAVDLIFEKDQSVILGYKMEKLLYADPSELFVKNRSPQPLFIVRKDLKCNVCRHIGAIRYYGSYSRLREDLSPAVGFGGTIPYECTNCGNVGLCGSALEGYDATFSQM